MTPALLLLLAAAAPAQNMPVAGGVVSSREWHVKRGAEKEEEFIGDVRYRTGATVIRSDWALFKHAAETWRLKGAVKVDRTLDSGDTAAARGDDAFFTMKDKSGWMTARDRVRFERAPADGTEADRALADRLEWKGRQRASLSGGVHLWGPRVEGWADRCDYDDATGELRFSGGRPVLRKFATWNESDDVAGALKADDVRAWQSKRRVEADGRVVGWLEFRDMKALGKGLKKR